MAVNLGGVGADEVSRGEVVALPGWLKPTRAVDARLRLLDAAPHGVRHNYPATFHAFAAETPARVRLLDAEELEPGDEAWAQLWFERPIALVRGDRFVIRSPDATLGGGVVVDVDARRHRRRHAPTLERLARLAEGSPTAQLLSALEGREPADVAALAKRANIAEADALALAREAAVEGSVVVVGGELGLSASLYTAAKWGRLASAAREALAAFHAQNPLRAGMTREELRSRLGLRGSLAPAVVAGLAESGAFVDDAGTLRLAGHAVAVSDAQRAAMNAYVAALECDPFPVEAPTLPADLLALLADEGRVVRAPQGVVFDAATYERLAGQVKEHLRAHGSITVAQARDIIGASRKYALALLERLDDDKATRRLGDERVLL